MVGQSYGMTLQILPLSDCCELYYRQTEQDSNQGLP